MLLRFLGVVLESLKWSDRAFALRAGAFESWAIMLIGQIMRVQDSLDQGPIGLLVRSTYASLMRTPFPVGCFTVCDDQGEERPRIINRR